MTVGCVTSVFMRGDHRRRNRVDSSRQNLQLHFVRRSMRRLLSVCSHKYAFADTRKHVGCSATTLRACLGNALPSSYFWQGKTAVASADCVLRPQTVHAFIVNRSTAHKSLAVQRRAQPKLLVATGEGAARQRHPHGSVNSTSASARAGPGGP